jgi:ABC-2 type transport system permease protein
MQVPFADFIAPGLIVMGMMNNAFANASFSLLVGKIQGTIVDYLMPLSTAELLAALVGGAVTRAVLVGVTVWAAMAIWPGVHVTPHAFFAVLWFGLLGSVFLALLGVDVDLGGEVRPCRRRHQFRGRAAVAAVGHLLFGRWPGPGVPCDQPCQPLLCDLGLPLRLSGAGRSPVTLGGAIVLGIDAMAVLCYVLLRKGWKLKN